MRSGQPSEREHFKSALQETFQHFAAEGGWRFVCEHLQVRSSIAQYFGDGAGGRTHLTHYSWIRL
jgi:hypothetical protein